MTKYECTQEMIFDLVIRHGCNVTFRPATLIVGDAVEVVISHKNEHSAVTIDLTRLDYLNAPKDEVLCRMIQRAAMELFRYPYDKIFAKHFRGGEDNG